MYKIIIRLDSWKKTKQKYNLKTASKLQSENSAFSVFWENLIYSYFLLKEILFKKEKKKVVLQKLPFQKARTQFPAQTRI